MHLDVDGVLFQLPSISRLVHTVYHELGQGRSVAIAAPHPAHVRTLWSLLADNLDRVPGIHLDFVPVEVADSDKPPACFLGEALHLETQSNGGDGLTYEIMRAQGTPGVVALRGLEQLSPTQVSRWSAFLREWATLSRVLLSEGYRRPPALLALAVALPHQMPPEDTELRVYWWWSLLSDLDVCVLCRLLEGVGYPELPHETAWREAVLPALAGNDLALVNHLWDVVHRPKIEILNALASFSHEMGWTAKNLIALGLPDFLRQRATRMRRFLREPTSREADLWASGLIYQTPEHGIQVSPLALAALNKWEMVEHLLWRGQASLLLPFLDELRLSLCQELTERYGPGWPLLWARPLSKEAEKAVRDNPLSTEWGHLKEAILRCPHSSERDRYNLATHAWSLRNELAHYQAIEFEDFQTLMRLSS